VGRDEGRIAFSYKFMRAALQAAAGKSGKPGLYPQEFASFQRSFEESLEGREREHVGGVVKRCRVSRGGLAARGTYLFRKALIYVCELNCLLNYKRTNS